MGGNTELEHGFISSQTNVTGEDPILTGKNCLGSPERISRLLSKIKEAGGGSKSLLEQMTMNLT